MNQRQTPLATTANALKSPANFSYHRLIPPIPA